MATSRPMSAWVAIPIVLVVWGVATLWEWGSGLFEVSETKPSIKIETAEAPIEVIDVGELKTEITPEDEVFICRATVAELMGRDLRIIEGVRRADGNVGTSYRRPSDNSLWQNLCKLNGRRIEWASMDESGIAGRWRTEQADEVVTFVLGVSGVTISQKFGDGSGISNSFARE